MKLDQSSQFMEGFRLHKTAPTCYSFKTVWLMSCYFFFTLTTVITHVSI